ncbi:MAG: M15 family metallopeptidase, partial [Thermocrispum sp.]
MGKRALTAALATVAVAALAATLATVAAGPASAGHGGHPPFRAKIERIGPELAEEMMDVSWRPGCPVPIEDLRLISMNHRGFDGRSHDGELMVHEDVARDVVKVFRHMYNHKFPIRRMERIEHYGGDDNASMDADNTSSFNCRQKTGGGGYSVHSYGKAIDINTIENPYIDGDLVLPEAGKEFLDRDDVRPGMIVDGGRVVRAFARRGFEWGGYWDSPIDYQ